MTLVLAFVITGAFAQIYPATIETDYDDVVETVYQTDGTTFRLYVAPDPAYSPLYDGTNPAAINANSEWRWVYGTDFAGGTLVQDWNTAALNGNYVEILADRATQGTRTYWVAERFSVGCADATGKSQEVTITAAPTATITGANADADWVEVDAGHEYYRCSSLGAGENLTVAFTETDVAAAFQKYSFSIHEQIYTIAADNTETLDSENQIFVNYAPTAAGIYDASATGTATIATSNLDIVGGLKTKYVYTLKGYNSAPDTWVDGLVSQISQKSEYIDGGVGNYPFTGTLTVTYIINLPPVTGPIYHIPNNWGL